MRQRHFFLLCLGILVTLGAAYAAVLPDACGNDKVSFDIRLEKNLPAPTAVDPAKGQFFFIEKSKKPPAVIGCLSCNSVTRFGVDGAWVGATKDNSYFTVSLSPGVHHFCAVRGKDVDAQAVTIEAGKTYYYQVEYNAEGTQYGTPGHPNYQVSKNVSFSMLNEDDGKYRVKISALSIATMKH